jgi:glycosyltransferase involved in cell wall biosynthesis
MRLLLYSSQFPTPQDPNGCIFTAQLAEALAKQAELSVVCPLPWRPDVSWARNSQVWRRYAGVPPTAHHGALLVHYPKYFLPPRISGSLQPWLQVMGVSGLLSRLHRRIRFDAINAHWIYPDGVAAVWMGRRLGIPVMLTALGTDINVYANYPARRKQILWAFRHANHISAVSAALVEFIKAMGVEPEKLSFIGNGVDSGKFCLPESRSVQSLRQRLGLHADRKYLLFVGRLHPVKGLSYLLEALSLLHSRGSLDFDTILVGEGALRPECESYISGHDLAGKVRLVGEIPHADVHEWLQACDVFCLPSLMEGMPNVVLEAQACGVPVVASRVGGIPAMVGPQAGVLVEPGNPGQLAEALEHALRAAWDREMIARTAGLQSWETVASRYLEVIEGAAKHAGRLRVQE